MDGGFHRRGHEHSPYQHICSVCLHWQCCVSCWHSQSLLQKLKDLAHVLMVRVFHVSQFWCWRSKFPLCHWSWTVLLSSLSVWSRSSRTSQFLGYWNVLWSVHWRISDFWTQVGSHQFPSFLSSVFTGLTRDPKLREEISSLLGSRATRHGLAFAIGKPSFESRLLTSFWHGALLSNLIVGKRNRWNGYKKTSGNS